MIRPINVGETIKYHLKDDNEDPTIFVIGILDSLIKSNLTDLGMVYKYNPDAPKESLAEARMDISKQELEFVRFGVKKIENFKDKDGKDIPFKTVKRMVGVVEYQIVSDETLKYIPLNAIRELANVIAAENKIGDQQRKNS